MLSAPLQKPAFLQLSEVAVPGSALVAFSGAVTALYLKLGRSLTGHSAAVQHCLPERVSIGAHIAGPGDSAVSRVPAGQPLMVRSDSAVTKV